MRILFTSIAGTGHFNPLIPYAQEMQRRGHEVRVASPEIMASQIAAAGLPHIVVGRPTDAERDAFFSQFAHLPPLERSPVMGGGLFADLLPKKALPKLQACVDAWRPNLIVREAGEYAAVIVSALTGTPHVRVSVSNGHTFKTTVGPTDALRQEFGLKPDHGMSLRGARAFSNFPAAMELPNCDGALLPQLRVSTHMTAPASGKAGWVFTGERPRIYLTFGTVMG